MHNRANPNSINMNETLMAKSDIKESFGCLYKSEVKDLALLSIKAKQKKQKR